jgi:hypothetical protein
MITKQLKNWVAEEARNLKRFATPEELAKLNFKTINAFGGHCNVYGQLTGNCSSKRASELLALCASVSFNNYGDSYKVVKVFKRGSAGCRRRYSAIETFMFETHNESQRLRRALSDFLTGKNNRLLNQIKAN